MYFSICKKASGCFLSQDPHHNPGTNSEQMLLFDFTNALLEVQRGTVTCSRPPLVTGGPGLELCLRLDFPRDKEWGGGSLCGSDARKHR